MSRSYSSSSHAQHSVLAALTASVNEQRITTISNTGLVAATIYSARTVEYALRDLKETGLIEVAYTRERQRAIKVL